MKITHLKSYIKKTIKDLVLPEYVKLIKFFLSKRKCVMCGEKGIFQVGSGQKAILNKRDCTKLIEAYYKKGDWLCEDCLFK